jgi:hypothetical protein
MINRDFIQGFAVGVGVTVAVSAIAVTLVVGRRPFARAVFRGGNMLVEKAREAAAEAGEIIEDLIAEARAEADDPYLEDIGAASPSNRSREEGKNEDSPNSTN